ncbi:MAG: hypothetical protein WCB12_15815 [Bryobacteraceae bacterium]
MPESPEQISNEIQDLLQQAVLSDYPNPERKGCAGKQVVREVAARQMPVQDAAWEHITHCSPCYREFLGFRAELAGARKRLVRRNRIVLVTVLAAAGIAGILIWTRGSHGVEQPPVVARKIQTPVINAMVAKVDLQPFSPARGEGNATAQSTNVAATLARQVVRLELSLPIGSDDGTYEVRIMDGQLRSLMSRSAATAFTDHVTTLSVTLDLSTLAPGSYVLGLKGPESGWRTYPIAVR